VDEVRPVGPDKRQRLGIFLAALPDTDVGQVELVEPVRRALGHGFLPG
jgi:hypothetical protein